MNTTTRLPVQGAHMLRLTATAMLVAIVGVAASPVHAQARPQADLQDGPHHAAHHRMGGAMDMGPPMLPARLLDAVGASADQKTRLREIGRAAQDDLQQQREAGRALHQQMMALLAAPQVDAAAAEALRQKQLAVHDAVSKRSLQAMLDAQAVLTPEQRQKLAAQMTEHHRRMEQRHDRRAPDAPRG